jgi:NAD+ kinase
MGWKDLLPARPIESCRLCGLIGAMSRAFKTVALIGKYRSPDVAEVVMRIAEYLHQQRGIEVWVESATVESIAARTEYPVRSYEAIGAGADLAVVLGGDGTMLLSARRLACFDVPLVGVNQGRLGFLTDISCEDAPDRLGAILDGRYSEERRTLLDAEVLRDGEPILRTLAMNDVVVNKGDVGRMIEFDVCIDGEYVYTQRSDGMIVSTATGSTAYALSANGPILHPGVDGIAVVPLCPHALTARPITLSDQASIEMVLRAPHEGRAHFDGQEHIELRAGDRVRVWRSERSVTLLHPEGYSYFAMLREKLHWSSSPRRQ